jgi:peptidoglycan/LPS O-acetylase OafA/YrhL
MLHRSKTFDGLNLDGGNMQKTFGHVLTAHKGLGPGFDFLRIALAFSIVLAHSFLLTGNDAFFRSSPLWFAEYALVPMFFALSGFLIAGSAQRLSLKNFLLNRGLRIVPALAVDIVVCALIIGPLVTTVALRDYFLGADFYKYFLNIIGWIHYSLPGVFEQNPTHRVNGALWTVPWEIFCYIIMSALMITSIIKSWQKLALLTGGFILSGLIVQSFGHLLPYRVNLVLSTLFVSRGAQLVFAFLLGILAYQLRDFIPHKKSLFLASMAVCVLAMLILSSPSIESVPNRLVVIPALVYITVFVGLTPVPLPSVFHKGDYSYGVYLYHDPFLQILISLAPGLFLIPKTGALALYAIGICAAMGIAVFSWHMIEKPILGMRKKFSFVAKARGVDENADIKILPVEKPVKA